MLLVATQAALKDNQMKAPPHRWVERRPAAATAGGLLGVGQILTAIDRTQIIPRPESQLWERPPGVTNVDRFVSQTEPWHVGYHFRKYDE